MINEYPVAKAIVGTLLILIGVAALVTPLTPGSWLVLIGLEFLGLRIVLRDWIFKKKEMYIAP